MSSHQLTFTVQQGKDVIVPVKSSTPAVVAATINKDNYRKAAHITAVLLISSHMAKVAAKCHTTDEERREKQRARDKQYKKRRRSSKEKQS